MRQRHHKHNNHRYRARLIESTRSDGSLDYHHLDRPAVIRKQAKLLQQHC